MLVSNIPLCFGLRLLSSDLLLIWCVVRRGVDLRRKFASIFKEFSQNPRPFYCHFTCVTVCLPFIRSLLSGVLISLSLIAIQDTKATSMILVDGEFVLS